MGATWLLARGSKPNPFAIIVSQTQFITIVIFQRFLEEQDERWLGSRPRQGGHPSLALLHARAPDVSVTGVVRRRSWPSRSENSTWGGWGRRPDAGGV